MLSEAVGESWGNRSPECCGMLLRHLASKFLIYLDFMKIPQKNMRPKTDSKSVVLATVPRVQIPISPPYRKNPYKSMIYEDLKVAICSKVL